MIKDNIILKINKNIEAIEPFRRIEDDSEYDVWKLKINNKFYVLKKAKNYEINVYKFLLNDVNKYIPKIYDVIDDDNEKYILMEYIEGQTLHNCDRKSLIKSIDALAYIQDYYWNNTEKENSCYNYKEFFNKCLLRGKYLENSVFEDVYNRFVKLLNYMPKTLCHNDLLPFNIIINEDAYIIDWECAGIMPYLVSFSRLIAHCNEDNKSLFFMKEEDKDYIIQYYYNVLIKDKNISYDKYINDLNYFIFFEYCEWIMLGIKYNNTESERYKDYYTKAINFIEKYNL